ncbi:hypothetical protein F943_01729 [Acinetobacter ursingii NIPH 706]|jgi:hypothetical protein|nr:hypothetical protein F943_01729 [Acinetobacter ursingii NIPH 706]EXD30759.1 hypothetical protein J500_3374 [Acinetobacter sp. 479375]RSO85010.1 hypothetical protein EA748_03505 [Acinetobacter ursingii]
MVFGCFLYKNKCLNIHLKIFYSLQYDCKVKKNLQKFLSFFSDLISITDTVKSLMDFCQKQWIVDRKIDIFDQTKPSENNPN